MAGVRSAPMVGRDGQLEVLRELAAEAASRRPSVVAVLGEAGIGKTRLVDELAASIAEDQVVVARGCCSPGAARGLPLTPVIEVVHDLGRRLGPRLGRLVPRDDPAIAALLPELTGAARAGEVAAPSQAQLFTAVSRLLRDVARARRVVIVVEDVHWADETSRELLEFVARSLRDEQLLLLITARTDDPAYETCQAFVSDLVGLRHGRRIELGRLTEAEVAEQVAGLRGGPVPDRGEIARIAEVADGVPLLVEELVDADLGDVGALADLLLGHRIARLPPPARAVVESAAVAVLEPTTRQLAAAAPVAPGQFDGAFADAVSGGVLVRRGDRVGFRHALLREAAAARTLPNALQELHRRWAAVIGSRPQGQAETVAAAHHRKEAGDLGGALEACVQAALLSRRLSAYAEEKQMLLAAAELWPRVPDAEERTGVDLADVYADAAWATHLSLADVAESKRLVDAAIAALPADASPHRRAMLDLLWHRTRWRGDDHLTTSEVLAAVGAVELEPPTEQATLACLEATDSLSQAGDPAGADVYARRAVEIAEAVGSVDLLARTLAARAVVLSQLAEDDAALRMAERAVGLAERSGDLFAQENALQALQLAQWLAAEDTLATGSRLVELLGGDRPGPLPGRWGIAQANHAEGLIDAGRWDDAQGVLEVVLHETMPDWIFWAAQRLADHLAVWRGGSVRARTADIPAEPVRTSLDDNTNLEDLLAVRYTYGDIASRGGDLATARRHLSVLGDDRIVANRGFLFPILWVAARTESDAAVSGRDPAPADGEWVAARVRQLLALCPPRNRRDRAYAAHTVADLERRTGDDSAAVWAAVVAGWRDAALPFPLATALVRAGDAYRSAGLPREAAAALREAVRIGERLGARPLVEDALAVARQAHLRLVAGPAVPGSDLGLTARELDVLRLVAAGASNSAVATALFISPKTVSVHVSNILAKLEVSSRGEAAAVAHRAGLVAP